MKLKFSKDNWFVRRYFKYTEQWPSNLCSLFWVGLFGWAGPMIRWMFVIALGSLMLTGFGALIVLVSYVFASETNPIMALAHVLGLLLLTIIGGVLLTIGGLYVFFKANDVAGKYLKAAKDNVCPLIDID